MTTTTTNKVLKIASIVAAVAILFYSTLATAQTAASPYTTGYRYNAAQLLTGTIAPDPDGSGPLKYLATRNTYDAAGLLVMVETGQLSSWKSEAVAPSAWTGFTVFQTTITDYDNWGRRLKVSVSSGGATEAVTQYSYDYIGRQQCVTRRMNPATFSSVPSSACTLATEGDFGPDRITKWSYDTLNRVTKVQKAYDTPIQQDYATYTYSGNGNRDSVTDANGNRAEMVYDGFDRQQYWYFPSKSSIGQINTADYEQYDYDADGNRTYLRKRDGQTITYIYDALSRMTKKDVPGTADDVYYDYDLRSLQQFARFGSVSGAGITNVFDGFGRLINSTTNMDGINRTLGYIYDANGNRIRVTHPDSKYFTYVYDGLDRVKQINGYTSTSLVTLSYDDHGRRETLNRTNGVGTNYDYDPVSRLDVLSHNLYGTANDVNYDFDHSPASQVVSRTTSNDAYVYAEHTNGTESYSINGLNQYESVGGATILHDMNGNLTSDGSVTYTYDIENRLKSASGANSATLKYDPLGRLYETSGGGTTTRFLYDGDALVAEYNTSGTIVKRYVHGPGIDEPLIEYAGSSVSSSIRRNLYADHVGSITARTNYSGAVININQYDSYGIPDSLNDGRFAYTGQILIPELGLYHYKARIYSPELGRFLQNDPIGYDDQVNLYAYVANDPLNFVDPFGNERYHLGVDLKLVWFGGGRAAVAFSWDFDSYEFSVDAIGGIREGAAGAFAISAYSEESSKMGNQGSLAVKGVAGADLGPIASASIEVGLEGNSTDGVSYIYPDESFQFSMGVSGDAKGGLNLKAKLGVDAGLDVEAGVNVSGPDTVDAVSDAVSSAYKKLRDWYTN